MSDQIEQRLLDARTACEWITRHIEDLTYEIYLGNELLRLGVERELEIIGEAIKRALDRDETLESRILDIH